MSACLILGGSGYVGCNWAKRLARGRRFERIVLADVRPPAEALPGNVEFVKCDVRQPMEFPGLQPKWLFNFAAVHREPGHAREEYFDTNLAGARNACALAEAADCRNILFTSSISVYGPLPHPTSESTPPYPSTPYGISKFCAELMHKAWRRNQPGRPALRLPPRRGLRTRRSGEHSADDPGGSKGLLCFSRQQTFAEKLCLH